MTHTDLQTVRTPISPIGLTIEPHEFPMTSHGYEIWQNIDWYVDSHTLTHIASSYLHSDHRANKLQTAVPS